MMSLVAFLIPTVLAASPPSRVDVVKVAGVVQYVEGRANKTEDAGTKADLSFQTPLYEGDRVETSPGSTVKIATRSGCLVVLRGEGRIEIRKTWSLRGDSVRILCSGHRGAFAFAFGFVTVQNGEVLVVDRDKLLAVNGNVSIGRVALEPRKLYLVDKSGAKPINKSETELREVNASQTPPRESFPWPAPVVGSTSRAMFGPAYAYEHAFYDNKAISEGNLTGLGPRLQLQFRTQNDHAFIVQLSQNETENSSRRGGPNTSPPTGASNTIERVLLELGRRTSFDKWWSPYWRLGAGYAKAKVGYRDASSSYSRFSYEFYVLTATYGIDAHLSPNFLKPFGLYAGVEAQVIESVARGGRLNENSGYSQATLIPDQPWRLTTLNAGANAGLEFYF